MASDPPPERPPEEGPAHDVLAAEAFAVPAPDPELSHDEVVVPEDPSGINEPHDVLAADEFPMPAGPRHPRAGGGPGVARARRTAIGVAGAVLAVLGVRRSRR